MQYLLWLQLIWLSLKNHRLNFKTLKKIINICHVLKKTQINKEKPEDVS